MGGVALLDRAHAAGLRLEADGERLIVRGPRLAEPIAQELLAHKGEVLSALAQRMEADMYRRVAAVYHAIPSGYVLAAEWETHAAPINGALATISAAKRRGDIASLRQALAEYEQYALAAYRCFVEALPSDGTDCPMLEAG